LVRGVTLVRVSVLPLRSGPNFLPWLGQAAGAGSLEARAGRPGVRGGAGVAEVATETPSDSDPCTGPQAPLPWGHHPAPSPLPWHSHPLPLSELMNRGGGKEPRASITLCRSFSPRLGGSLSTPHGQQGSLSADTEGPTLSHSPQQPGPSVSAPHPLPPGSPPSHCSSRRAFPPAHLLPTPAHKPGRRGLQRQTHRGARGEGVPAREDWGRAAGHRHWWRREAARWTRWSQACDLDNAHGWLRTSRAPAAGHTVGSCSLCTLP